MGLSMNIYAFFLRLNVQTCRTNAAVETDLSCIPSHVVLYAWHVLAIDDASGGSEKMKKRTRVMNVHAWWQEGR